MAQITFDKLKENCVREFCYKNTRATHGSLGCGTNNGGKFGIATLVKFKQTGKFTRIFELAKEVEDDCAEVIKRVDLRNLKPLIELCPDSVPKWIQNGNYTLDLDDKGWTFFKKN